MTISGLFKKNLFCFLIALLVLSSCGKKETAVEILQKMISSIDTIETIYYKQDMWRSSPRNASDTLYKYREMYFERLTSDSIVGNKGHWYMYSDDKVKVTLEDIYDGERLIRKNNNDSAARVYDLNKYPDFRKEHFWSHNTLYGMQHEFRFMLKHTDSYSFERLNDTVFDGKSCFQVLVRLENKMTMPGFAIKLEDYKGLISTNLYVIDKETSYPLRMKGENYLSGSPEEKSFIEQKYYDIEFNLEIKENQFVTSLEAISGYKIQEMKPKPKS